MRRGLAIAAASAALVVGGAPPAGAGTEVAVVAEARAIAFTVRLAYDPGGAASLPLYVGYADASATERDADGQASWYNLNIAETAAFRPREDCTPSKNLDATLRGLRDVQDWLTGTIGRTADAVARGEDPPTPIAPGPHHACSERFGGFAQSRSPATGTIPESSTDTLLDRPTEASACAEDPASAQCRAYREHWPEFTDPVRDFARDGAFSATSTDAPAHESSSLLFGAGDGTVVSVGLARNFAAAEVRARTLVVEATTVLDDVCVMRRDEGCSLSIDRVRHVARVEVEPGREPRTTERTSILGARAAGQEHEVTPQTVLLDRPSIELGGGSLALRAVSRGGDCDPATDVPGTVVADAGGLLLAGKGPPQTRDLPDADGVPDEVTIPGGGGGIMIGGACVRARIGIETFDVPAFDFDPGDAGRPPSLLTIPGAPDRTVLPPGAGRSLFGPARAVSRTETSYVYRRAVAWRTAPWWGSVLGAMGLAAVFGYRFRRTPAVAPVAGLIDGFARRFLRG